MAKDAKLTTKQAKAIPILLAGRSYEEGCKAAGISKTTLYAWMGDYSFKTEFERQRNELAETAFGVIAQNTSRTVATLVGLLDTGDSCVKRLTANDIISHYLKHKELVDLERRIEAIEERLEGH